MTFTVTTSGEANESMMIEHADAVTVVVEEGHLVLRSNRGIVGIYAPGRWANVVETRGEHAIGRRMALPAQPA
ncbi:hypothetical protein ISU10_17505 [Nocardioides agariphilus]|uniref:Uncharacterized protein n=1 Tax=Nocardioides agariphilus TaxID=433664 RepID=A0A930VRY4_9ACTN|nr:hypothetical protein [Nocardioides agariphilus]MBF4769567.1 hypothetical protein [Nocardioides agariphilus]